MSKAYYSSVLDRPIDLVWGLVRDFNNYPRYIEGVTESVIEDDKRGDEVGAVRRFRYGGAWIRQRLAAHSDADRCFSYIGLDPFPFPDGSARSRPHRSAIGARCGSRQSSTATGRSSNGSSSSTLRRTTPHNGPAFSKS